MGCAWGSSSGSILARRTSPELLPQAAALGLLEAERPEEGLDGDGRPEVLRVVRVLHLLDKRRVHREATADLEARQERPRGDRPVREVLEDVDRGHVVD